MKTKLTEVIRKSNALKLMTMFDYIPSIIANIFSVIFSTSIIFELNGIVDNITLMVLSVFIILFLIQNEIIKVKEIRKVFAGSKNALLPFTITFIISISLATIGMYFYTNKSTEIKHNSEITNNINSTNLDLKYEAQYNEINSKTYESTEEFKYFNNELKYWKKLNAATLIERSEIRSKVEGIQKDLYNNRLKFENNIKEQINRINILKNNEKKVLSSKLNNDIDKTRKNDFITYIFLSLILITEFSTIVLNKNIVEKQNVVKKFVDSKLAKTYIVASNLLTTLYMSAKNNVVNINNAKYSYANKDNCLEWEEIKTIYNNFISLGILSTGEIRKENEKDLLYNEILIPEVEAQIKLNEYFERFFKI